MASSTEMLSPLSPPADTSSMSPVFLAYRTRSGQHSYQRGQLFVALTQWINTRVWLGRDLLNCSPALSPPPLRHYVGIKTDILRIMQGFMIPCCRRTRHWPLQTLPAPVLPHDSLAGTPTVTIFHHRARLTLIQIILHSWGLNHPNFMTYYVL